MKNSRFISVLITIIILFTYTNINAQVAINSDGSAPSPSAMLDVKSTDKGILIPRVNGTNSITSLVKGLLVYNTVDDNFYYFNGSSWKKLKNTTTNFTNLTTSSAIGVNDDVVLCSGLITVTLMTVVNNAGKTYTIKNVGANKVLVKPNGSEIIEKNADYTLNAGESITITTNGSAWYIISKF